MSLKNNAGPGSQNSNVNLKKHAKRLSKELGIPHAKALDIVAAKYGYRDYADAVTQRQRQGQLELIIPKVSVPSEIPLEDREREREVDLAPDAKLTLAANRAYLASKGIEFSVFEPTATGLRKRILDATQPVRTHFELEGFHSYASQGKGQNHKVVKDAFLVAAEGLTPSRMSMYRPETKNGDPRMWFKGLPEFANPGDQLGIIIHRDAALVLNISGQLLSKSESAGNEISRLLDEYSEGESTTASELLALLRKLAQKPIPSTTSGSTAIGMSIEAALGIPPNSSKAPDYKGIELKSARNNKNRSTLFAQVADWNLSKCKSSAEILDNYGYQREEDFRLYCTVSTKQANSQGLKFIYDEGNDLLEECHSDGQQVAAWPGNLLRGRLLEKHRETFWIQADSIDIGGKEHFILKSVVHTRSPMLSQLMPLIASGVVTMDHLIKRKDGRVQEKGPLFKLHKDALKLLVPTPQRHSLA